MAYDAKKIYYRFDDHLSRLVLDYEASRQISPESENLYHGLPTAPYDEDLFVEHNVKRGLRNADGSGVVAGLTRISDVHGYNKVDGKVVPDQGKLTLRGYSIEDLVNNAQAENRYGYEEVAYLLITGSLPNKEELDGFCERLSAFRHLSDEYVKEFPMTTVSSSIMNVLQRAVLLLYAFDAEPDVITPEHEIDVAISMLARLPRIAAFAHMASVAKLRGSEVHVPHPTPGLSTAETILQVLRGGMAFTRDEAMLLDVMLMLHAEHGGGNNSTFACRVLSSSATDPYSAYAVPATAVPAIAFIGYQNSGKTTLVEKVIAELTRRGLRVGSLKHHGHHGFDIDVPAKDTWRHHQAGSKHVGLICATRWAEYADTREEDEMPARELLSRYNDVDVVIIEGYKTEGFDNIVVARSGVDRLRGKSSLDLVDGHTLALACNEALARQAFDAGFATRAININDARAICDLIQDHLQA